MWKVTSLRSEHKVGKGTNPINGFRPRERDATLHYRYYLNYRNKRLGAKDATPPKQEEASKEENGPDDAIPIKATTSWQVEKKGPIRYSERKHVPRKRYGIDLVTEEKEGPEKEVN